MSRWELLVAWARVATVGMQGEKSVLTVACWVMTKDNGPSTGGLTLQERHGTWGFFLVP